MQKNEIVKEFSRKLNKNIKTAAKKCQKSTVWDGRNLLLIACMFSLFMHANYFFSFQKSTFLEYSSHVAIEQGQEKGIPKKGEEKEQEEVRQIQFILFTSLRALKKASF